MIEFTLNFTNKKIGVNPESVATIQPSSAMIYDENGKIKYEEDGKTPKRETTTLIELAHGEENTFHVKELYPEVLYRLNNNGAQLPDGTWRAE